MQLHFLKGIEQFQSVPLLSDRVQSYLLEHEAEHNLLLALLLRWIDSPDRFSEPPRIAIVEENGEILAIAFQTPPHKLVLSKCRQESALALIAETLAQQQFALPCALVD